MRGTPQNSDQRSTNDELLSCIEHGQRGLTLQPHAAQLFQVFVVAGRFKLFVVEVLDGLVVQQRINGFGMRCRLLCIGFLAKARAPFGHRDGEGDVEHQRCQRNDGKPGIKTHRQDTQHQPHFNQRGQDGVQRVRDQRFRAAHAALDIACHAAGLTLQVKAQT